MSSPITASPRKSHQHYGCARDSFVRAAKKPLDVIYDLPGMADKMGSRDMTGYSFGPTPATRDSFVKATRKCLDVTYDVPGMADAIAKDPKGTYAFKQGPGDRLSYVTRHMKEVIRREPVHVAGMAEAAAMSPKGTAAFRQSSARDSYIRATKKPLDVIYDLPGMADKMGSRDMTGYSFGPTPATRDSFVKATRKCLDVTYDVPGMAEAIAKDPKGTYAFKQGPGDRLSYVTRHMKEVIRREPVNIPGMADSLHQKPYGTFHQCCPNCTASRAASSSPRRPRASSAPSKRPTVASPVSGSRIARTASDSARATTATNTKATGQISRTHSATSVQTITSRAVPVRRDLSEPRQRIAGGGQFVPTNNSFTAMSASVRSLNTNTNGVASLNNTQHNMSLNNSCLSPNNAGLATSPTIRFGQYSAGASSLVNSPFAKVPYMKEASFNQRSNNNNYSMTSMMSGGGLTANQSFALV